MQPSDRAEDVTAPIALIAAMESELRHALERLEDIRSERFGAWTIHRGRLHNRPVVAIVTGIGMVNAAAATSLLLEAVRPAITINYGCAGAHREDIHPGDVVMGTGVVAHLSLTILPSGEERYAGFRYQLEDETVLTDMIAADRALLDVARNVVSGWTPAPWPWSIDEARPAAVHLGVIASADCWTQDPVRIGGLHDLHGSLCEDMEAAAIAQVCAMYRVPMLAIKDISNNELHDASEQGNEGLPSLDAVEKEIGARAFALVERIVANLGSRQIV